MEGRATVGPSAAVRTHAAESTQRHNHRGRGLQPPPESRWGLAAASAALPGAALRRSGCRRCSVGRPLPTLPNHCNSSSCCCPLLLLLLCSMLCWLRCVQCVHLSLEEGGRPTSDLQRRGQTETATRFSHYRASIHLCSTRRPLHIPVSLQRIYTSLCLSRASSIYLCVSAGELPSPPRGQQWAVCLPPLLRAKVAVEVVC